MSSQFLPRARRENLIIQNMGDEIVLYDTLTNQAHVLNPSAALVWKFSDGKCSVPRLAQLVARELHAQPDTALVELALKQLAQASLLEQTPASLPSTLKFTRREFIQKAALAAMVVPVVKTISAPTLQQSSSCVEVPCKTQQDCCDEWFCGNGFCFGCFVAGTPVLYADGTRRPIETVNVGDLVLARNERTGTLAPQPVAKQYIHPNRQAFTLDFGSSQLDTTSVHPFYTDAGWIHASELRQGMDCYSNDGSRVILADIKHPNIPLQTVYNLEVANFHTYFVGDAGIWVHNKG